MNKRQGGKIKKEKDEWAIAIGRGEREKPIIKDKKKKRRRPLDARQEKLNGPGKDRKIKKKENKPYKKCRP